MTLTGVAEPPNLDEVLVAGDRGEGDLRLPITEVVIAFYQVAKRRIAVRPIIDGELGVIFAATQADGNVIRARSGITVPDVWAGHTVAGAIESRSEGVERLVCHVTDGYCVIAVVVWWWSYTGIIINSYTWIVCDNQRDVDVASILI